MATIADVAKLTGLSRATVSRVMNNYPHVSEDKKRRVYEAMEILNYTPNSAAQRLRSQKTNTIAVLIPILTNPFFAHLLERIDTVATENNLQLLVCQTRMSKQKELQFLDLLKTKHVDGIILTSLENAWEEIAAYTSYGPIVLCNEYSTKANVPMVHADQAAGAYIGTRHLIEQGARKVAYFGDSESNTMLTMERRNGYRKALAEFGLPLHEEWLFKGDSNLEEGRRILRKIAAMEERPDAIFTGSDQIGAGIILEAKLQGIHIPNDLAVIGFDDQEIAEVVGLTTIRQPIGEMGTRILEELLDSISSKEKQTQRDIHVPLELVVRNSTKKLQ